MVEDTTLLDVQDLRVWFRSRGQPIRAVEGVSLRMRPGETVALVGESGSGKTVTALSLARLVPDPGYCAGGRILFMGEDVITMRPQRLRQLRGAEISYIFQEPATSLNPVFKVGYQIAEAIKLHRRDADARRETIELMRLVGLPTPEQRMNAYPHELSGGMQQRVMIAMALACHPKLLIADEPTTALDVTIQAQILDLLKSLQGQLHMSILLITHNFGLVADVAHWVYVMYAGRIVEAGPTETVLTKPAHPYTKALLNAVPRLAGRGERMSGIEGTVPNPARLPPGCPFNPRCPSARDLCREREPADEAIDEEHRVRCHYWR
jgi:oligopeptide/dipeptide ABC transporter ATP-binding protein